MKTKEFKGDLILKENTTFDCDIKVYGNIICEEGIWDIKARDIKAMNIDAGNIKARNIDVWDIKARNIVCEKRIKKSKAFKTICRVFITNKSKLERKEQVDDGR